MLPMSSTLDELRILLLPLHLQHHRPLPLAALHNFLKIRTLPLPLLLLLLLRKLL
jgi:hypothetical protein